MARVAYTLILLVVSLGSSGCRRPPEPQKPSLYVVNWRGGTVTQTSLSGCSISAFTIDQSTGALGAVPGSPFRDQESIPRHVRVAGDGALLFLDGAGLRRSPGGELAPLRRAFLTWQKEDYRVLATDPRGRFVFAGRGGRKLHAFRLDSPRGSAEHLNGTVSAIVGDIEDAVVDPFGRFLYLLEGGRAIHGYTIDATSGALTPVAGSPFPAGPDARWIRVHPSADFLFAAGGAPNTRPDSRIQVFRIDYLTGALQPLPGSRYPGAEVGGLSIEPTGRFFYVAEYSNDRIWGFEIDSRGGFAAVPGAPFNSGRAPIDVIVESTGRFLYAANSKSNDLSAYAIDAGTGALVPVPGSPFKTGDEPTVLAVTAGPQPPVKTVELRDPALPGALSAETDPAGGVTRDVAGVWPPDGASLDDLVARLKDGDWRVRYATAVVLGRRRERALAAVPALVAALDDQNEEVVRSAADAVGAIGLLAREAVPRLTSLLASRSPSIRQSAAGALGAMGPDAATAVPRLIESLAREDYVSGRARAKAAEALQRIHAEPERCAAALVGLLGVPETALNEAATAALRSFGPDARDVVPQLIELLESGRPAAVVAASRVLESVGPAAGAAIPALVGACQDREFEVRTAASRAFYGIRGNRIE